MKKTLVIYWSGTGNTEAMAGAVLEGMKAAGADAALLTPDQVTPASLSGVSSVAMGCPAMGSEVLEEMEFQPMFDSIKNQMGGKAVGLFGSFGWGDGEWMRSWEKDCDDAGINRVCDSITCCEAPDDDVLAACQAMGRKRAEYLPHEAPADAAQEAPVLVRRGRPDPPGRRLSGIYLTAISPRRTPGAVLLAERAVDAFPSQPAAPTALPKGEPGLTKNAEIPRPGPLRAAGPTKCLPMMAAPSCLFGWRHF